MSSLRSEADQDNSDKVPSTFVSRSPAVFHLVQGWMSQSVARERKRSSQKRGGGLSVSNGDRLV